MLTSPIFGHYADQPNSNRKRLMALGNSLNSNKLNKLSKELFYGQFPLLLHLLQLIFGHLHYLEL
jgi:hypothetical protein